jgi:hypothetical protein
METEVLPASGIPFGRAARDLRPPIGRRGPSPSNGRRIGQRTGANASVCQIPFGNQPPVLGGYHEIGSLQVDPVRFGGRVALSISSPRNQL